MKKPLVVVLPHNQSKQEAQQRIRAGVEKYKPQLQSLTSTIEEEWQDDVLHFRTVVMGQSVSGRIHVMDDSVRAEIDLPLFLAALAERLRGQIEKAGAQILLGKN